LTKNPVGGSIYKNMQNKKCHFDPEIATKYGLREAVLYEYIRFWCAKNANAGRNQRENYYWTYGSSTELSKKIPFLTPKQIWLSLKSLERQGAIVIGRFNVKNYDRTAWYRINYP
jgi:hypothetical protein